VEFVWVKMQMRRMKKNYGALRKTSGDENTL